MIDEGFPASCVRCGASQKVVLGHGLAACRYCGEASPLGAEGTDALAAANRRVFRLAATEHRRRLAHRVEVEELALLAPLAFVPCWLLFGGLAIGAAWPSASEASLWALLTTERHAVAASDEWIVCAWVTWVALSGFALTVSTYLVALVWARGAASAEHALPPLEGGPTRCHLCGAGLPAGGAVRACGSCGASNLTTDSHLRQSAETLMQQLQLLAARERESLDLVSRQLPNFTLFCALFPLMLLVAYPVAGLLHETRPDLLWMPAALALPGAIALAAAVFQRPPKALRLTDTRGGEVVRVKGMPYRVWGRYVETPSVSAAVVLVAEGATEPTLALDFYESAPGDETTASVLEPAGEPLRQGEALGAALRIRTIGGEWQGTFVEGSPRRVFAAGAAVGARPRWTLRSEPLPKIDVFVV